MKRITFAVPDDIHKKCHQMAKNQGRTLTALVRGWLEKKASRNFPLWIDVYSHDYLFVYQGRSIHSSDMHGHSVDEKNLSICFLVAPEGAGRDYNDLLEEVVYKFDTFDQLANFYKSYKAARLKGRDRIYMDSLIKKYDV